MNAEDKELLLELLKEADDWGDYSFYEGKHFLWGCQLFPTEEEARKSFG